MEKSIFYYFFIKSRRHFKTFLDKAWLILIFYFILFFQKNRNNPTQIPNPQLQPYRPIIRVTTVASPGDISRCESKHGSSHINAGGNHHRSFSSDCLSPLHVDTVNPTIRRYVHMYILQYAQHSFYTQTLIFGLSLHGNNLRSPGKRDIIKQYKSNLNSFSSR